MIVGSPLVQCVQECSVFQYHAIPIRTLLCSTKCASRPSMQPYFGGAFTESSSGARGSELGGVGEPERIEEMEIVEVTV
jgi:hypothetical protein